ncbi:DUF1028 domain-containing protein, partial [Leclercia adecarboxylata]|uniref:DUF1028 domain-containing protein n=1 Tax=Leclercia adecarboxylata TaxID=83655 RepID=UPI00234CD57A
LGGDRHGQSSATVYVVDREEYPLWDIRVDHHLDLVAALRRLHDALEREVVPAILAMSFRANPAGSAEEDSI